MGPDGARQSTGTEAPSSPAPPLETPPPPPPSPPPAPPGRGPSPAAALRWLSGRTFFWFVLVAVAYFVGWGLFYVFYLAHRSPATVHLRATLTPLTDHEATPRIVLGGTVGWQISQADVKELDIAEAARGSRLTLPVASHFCSAFHPRPRGCGNGSVTLEPTVAAQWRKPEFLTAARASGTHTTITVIRTQQGARAIGLVAGGGGRVSACFSPPIVDVLTLEAAGSEARWPVGHTSDMISCGNDGGRPGLRVDLGQAGSDDSLFLDGVSSLELSARATTIELRGKASAVLSADGEHDVADDPIALSAVKQLNATLSFDTARSEISLVVQPVQAKSARVAGQELLPTNLARNRWWLVSGFCGGIGLLTSLYKLGQSIHERMDAKKGTNKEEEE